MLIRRTWPAVSERGRVSWLVGRLMRTKRPSDIPPFRHTVVLTARALGFGFSMMTAFVVTLVCSGHVLVTLLWLLMHNADPMKKKKRNVHPPKVTDSHGRWKEVGRSDHHAPMAAAVATRTAPQKPMALTVPHHSAVAIPADNASVGPRTGVLRSRPPAAFSACKAF